MLRSVEKRVRLDISCFQKRSLDTGLPGVVRVHVLDLKHDSRIETVL